MGANYFPFPVRIEGYEPGYGWEAHAQGSSLAWLRDAAEEARAMYPRVRAVAVPSGEEVTL